MHRGSACGGCGDEGRLLRTAPRREQPKPLHHLALARRALVLVGEGLVGASIVGPALTLPPLDPGVIPNFFSPEEAEAMRRSVQAFKSEGMLHDQSTGPADGVQNYQMHWLSEVSGLWRALPWEDRVMEAVTALLDCPNIEVHLDQMFLKPPKVGRGTLHHQDNGALPPRGSFLTFSG